MSVMNKIPLTLNSWIVSMGTPFDGLTLYGPFDNSQQAIEWASENDNGEPWEVAEINRPE